MLAQLLASLATHQPEVTYTTEVPECKFVAQNEMGSLYIP
jgi:hypothetical protein